MKSLFFGGGDQRPLSLLCVTGERLAGVLHVPSGGGEAHQV